MFEAYTENARFVVFFARLEAGNLGAAEIQSTHLLLGLLRQPRAMFVRLNIPGPKLAVLRKACVWEGPLREPVPESVDIPLGQESVAIFRRVEEEMSSRGQKEVDVEHFLLAALHVPSRAKEILNQHGLTYKGISANIFKPRPDPPQESALDYT